MSNSGSETSLVSDTDDCSNRMFWTLDEDITREDLLRLIKSSNPLDKEKLNVLFEEILEKDEEEIEFFEFLLSNGYRISALNDKKMTIIHSSFYSNNYSILDMSQKYIPNLDDNIDYTDCNGLTHLHVASAQNNKEFIEKCLKSNQVDVNSVFYADPSVFFADPSDRRSGFTALHFALIRGGVSTVKLLLEHGADVNAKDEYGRTPLHLSCSIFEDPNENVSGSYIEIMKILLENNADIEARDAKGNTPLLSIFPNDYNKFTFVHYPIPTVPLEETKLKLQFLLKAGADVTNQDIHGDTLLHLLVESLFFLRHSEKGICFDDAGVVDLMELVLNLNDEIEVNAKNHRWYTPLQLAVWFKSVDVVKALLQHDASFDNITLTINDSDSFYYPNVFPNLEVVVNILGIIEFFLDKGFVLADKENLGVLKFLVHDVDDCECGRIFFKGFDGQDAHHLRNLMNYGSPSHAQHVFEKLMAQPLYSPMGYDVAIDLHVRRYCGFYANKKLVNVVWTKPWTKLLTKYFDARFLEPEMDAELVRMKSMTVRENVTLYDVMCKHPHSIYHYLQNIDVKSFADPFSWYKDIMKGHVTQSLVRRYVENSAYSYLKESLFPSLPDVCCRMLLNYLSNEDILRTCIAFTN